MRGKYHVSFFITILILCICNVPVASESASVDSKRNSGIVYGDDHSYLITAPEGWVLDNEAGVSQGLHAVFYPVGQSWKKSPVVMYANWARKDGVIKDIKSLIALNIDRLKSRGSSHARAELKEKIKIDGNKNCQIWKYSGDQWGNHELVGYIDEDKGIVLLVLTSRDEKSFIESYKSFIDLIRSYSFVTDDVGFEKK